MSRLFSLRVTADRLREQLGAEPAPSLVVPPETVEGSPGVVAMRREKGLVLRALGWGFPRSTVEARRRGDPPSRIGLVADLTNPMWEGLVVDPRYHCLIPLTHFANPAGEPGAKTRTWFSLADQPIACWAGFCRNTPEFGPVFAGMTMTANAAVMLYNDRMPVLLDPAEHDRWFGGSIRDVIALQFRAPPPADRVTVTHTGDRWRSGSPPPEPDAAPDAQPGLL